MEIVRKLSSVVLGKNTGSNEENPLDDDEPKDIVKKDVKLPECFKNRLAFVLYNVLTEKECNEYIQKTEKKGYDLALVNIGGGLQMKMKDVRNSSRCIWDSFDEADRIWQRIKTYIPETWNGRKVMGLNERLRFLRYHPGEYFKTHMDGEYRRENGERSFITIQLYLNEGFKGGSTTFFDFSEKEAIEVVPKTGMVLVFQHDILHEGSMLKKGVKYSMRTDVMYAAQITKEKKKVDENQKTTDTKDNVLTKEEELGVQSQKSTGTEENVLIKEGEVNVQTQNMTEIEDNVLTKKEEIVVQSQETTVIEENVLTKEGETVVKPQETTEIVENIHTKEDAMIIQSQENNGD